MYVLTISNDINQSFSFDADGYNTTIVLKCPDDSVSCGFSRPPLIDIYIDGYPNIFGVPLVSGVDVLADRVNSGCAPLDYGAIIPFTSDGSELTCEKLVTNEAALVYLNAAELLYINFLF